MQEKNPRAEWFDFVNRYLKEPAPEEHLPIDHREFLQKIKLYFDNRTVMCDGKVDLSYVFLRLKGLLDEFMDKEFRNIVNHLKAEIHNLKDKENKDWYDLRTDIERKSQNIDQKLRALDDKLHKEVIKLNAEIQKISGELEEKLEGELEETKEELITKIEEVSTTFEDALKVVVDNLKEEFNTALEEINTKIEETKTELGEKIDSTQSDLDAFEALKGQPGGLAELDDEGKIADSQLPSWTDDVIEVFASYEVDETGKLSDIHLYEDFKQTEEITEGEAGKIYIDITKEDPTYMFRWTGKKFIKISGGDVVIGTSEGTAYDGAEGQYNRDSIKSLPSKIATQWNQSESKATSDSYVAVLDVVEKDDKDQYTSSNTDSLVIPVVTDENAGLMSPTQKELLEKIDGDYASKDELNDVKDNLQEQIDEIVGEGTAGEITNLQDQINDLKDEHEKDVAELKESISETKEELESEISETKEYVDTKVEEVDAKVTEIIDSKGQPNGIATLDEDGLVSSSQLPSYIDDVVDVFATYEKAEDGSLYNIQLYLDAAHTKAVVGETDKIYVDISQDAGPEPVGTLPYYQFRWSGTKFVQITCGGLILGEVDNTAYEGSKGAYNRAAITALPGEVVVSVEDGSRTENDITYQIGYNQKSSDDQYGTVETREITIPTANSKEAGLMSASDKAALDAVPDTYVTKDEYTGEDKNLQEEIDALKEQHEKDVDELTSSIEELGTEVNEKTKALQDSIDNLNYEEHECEDAINNLTTTVDELSKKHDEDVQELTEKIDSNTSKIETLESTTSKTAEDLDSLESRVSDCESSINANTNNIETLQSGLEGVEQRVSVNETNISNLDQDVEDLKSKDEDLQSQIDSNLEVINELIDSKQDKLTAGTAIDIYEKNGETIIDCTIDTTLYKIVTVLPEKPDEGDENKIFVVPSPEQGEENIYVEYLYVVDAWEKIGELHSEVDLSDYYTKEEVDDTTSRLESAISTNAQSIEKLDETVEVHTDNIKANADAIADLQTSVSTLENTTSTQGESIADLQTKVAENTEAINILDDDLGDARESIDDNTQSIENLKATLEDTVEKVNENTSSIESLENSVGELENTKQDNLSAGVGIDITDNVVSCTLDTQVFIIVTVLPEVGEENKIYLVPTSEEPGNIYTEYLYIGNAWEKIGEYKADVDLSDYYTKEEVDEQVNGLSSEIDTNKESISELDSNLGALDARFTSTESQVETNTNNISSLQSQVDTNTSDISTLKETTTELQSGVQDLGSVTDDLQSQITSNKESIDSLSESKQDNLSAGVGIDITDNIVSCTLDTQVFIIVTVLPEVGEENKIYLVPTSEEPGNIYTEYLYIGNAWEKIGEYKADVDLSEYAKITYVDEQVDTLTKVVDTKADQTDLDNLSTKQQSDYDTLTALVSDLTGVEHTDFSEVSNLISETKAQVEINTNDISNLQSQVDTNTSDIDTLKSDVSDLSESKQDNLTAGTGIDITDNVVSCTLDTQVFIIVTALPEVGEENKIYLVPTSEEPGNIYTEYLYIGNAWEKIGEFKADVDLSDYYTKEEVDEQVSGLSSEIEANSSDISTLQSDLQTTNSKVDALEDTTEELEGGIQDLGSVTDDLQSQITSNKESIDNLESSKQDKLTAGTGISITTINDESVIECTIDHTIYKIETVLPEKPDEGDENKIFCIPSSEQGEENVYIEYIYVTDAWEKIGEFKPDVDLSNYYTKDETYSKDETNEKISTELSNYIKTEIADERYATKSELSVFETEINNEISNIESQIEGDYVTKEEYDTTTNELQSQIDELKEKNELLLEYIVQILDNIGPNKD